jgi:hypothetical protein
MQRVYIDLGSVPHPARAALSGEAGPSIACVLGTELDLGVHFFRNNTQEALAGSSTGKLTLKAPGALAGPALFLDATMTPTGSGAATIYKFSGVLSSNELVADLGELERKAYRASIAWTEPTKAEAKCSDFDLVIENSSTRPADVIPATTDARWQWIKTAAPEANGFTHDDQTKTLTVEAGGILGLSSMALNASNLTGTINSSRLPASGVTAGSYTATNLSVDATGRITAASNGASASPQVVNGNLRLVTSDGTVFYVPVTSGEIPPPLTGLTSNLAGAFSSARRTVPTYGGPLIRVYNSTTTTQTDIPQTSAGLLDETALAAARTGSQKLYIHTFYNQDLSGNNLVTGDVTKALLIVNAAGTIQRLGRMPCGVAEADSTGMYKTGIMTAYTGATLTGYFVGTLARNPGIFGSYGYGVANGSTALWSGNNGAILLYRFDQTVAAYQYRNTVAPTLPNSRSFWEDERIVAVTRFTGADSVSDTGFATATLASTANFNFNKILVGGVNDSSHSMSINSKFAECAVWKSDLGATTARTLQGNAAGAFAAQSTKWNGKKVIWCGTSMPVTVTDDSNRNPYPQRLADAIGAWIVNVGTGSSRITYSSTYNLTLSATKAEQIANGYTSSQHESYETKLLGGVGAVDYVVIDHCLNDHLATMGAVTSTTKTEYCGALNFIRSQVLAAHPNCKFICLTPLSNRLFNNTVPTEINTAAATLRAWAAQYADCVLIDPLVDLAWGASEITAYCGDGTHLNAAGAAVVANYLITKFGTIRL